LKKVVMVNGSPRKSGGTSAVFEALREGIESAGVEVREYRLNDLNFHGCQGCMGCKRTGSCVVADDLSPVLEDIRSADALVTGSPIYMFAVSGQLSLFLNRLYSLIDGEYRPYAGRTRRYLSVYSMGSPSASYATNEANRVRQAMGMLGFAEVDRITLTGVFPGTHAFRLSDGERAKLVDRGMRFARSI
jgi:multimeric flavodoxin WrbA